MNLLVDCWCCFVFFEKASMSGKAFGRMRWSGRGNPKTVEGSVGGALSTFVTLTFLVWLRFGLMPVSEMLVVLLASVLGFCLEGCTEHIDNLVLPPFFVSSLVILRGS
eukprot:c20032_g1_i2.p3 GENE.c20032_g1_i2~~c20032_g1_i2.p3  ORF type:complete len:108 (+),score=23.66 c20032_g1_i2:263-586(+)